MRSKMFSVCVAATTFGFVGCGAEAASYYVSPKGNDANRGTSLNAPLRTIQKAVDAAMPGDTILIRGGTYRETVSTARSGTSAARITIQNYRNEVVTVRGTDPIVGNWTAVNNEVYRAPMPWNYHFENESRDYNSNQVFHNGQMMELVRWPNQTSSDLVQPDARACRLGHVLQSDPALASNDLATFHKADFTDNPPAGSVPKYGSTFRATAPTAGPDRHSRLGDGRQHHREGHRYARRQRRLEHRHRHEFYLFQPTLAALQNRAASRRRWTAASGSSTVGRSRSMCARTAECDRQPGSRSQSGARMDSTFDGDSFLTLRGIGLFATSLDDR
jgi:hypothetical protein